MKLKTLKDIEFEDLTYQGNCDEEDVRQQIRKEAIKWAKELKKTIPFGIFKVRHSEIITQNRTGAKIQWIREFFNITEDDLE